MSKYRTDGRLTGPAFGAPIKRHAYAVSGGPASSSHAEAPQQVPPYLRRGNQGGGAAPFVGKAFARPPPRHGGLGGGGGSRSMPSLSAASLSAATEPLPAERSSSHRRRRRSRPGTSGSDRDWAVKSTKLQNKRGEVARNRMHTFRLRSLTLRPPVSCSEASLVPDDMRLSPTLPPPFPSNEDTQRDQQDIQLLEQWLSEAEKRLRRRRLPDKSPALLAESQLLYSSAFAELTRQVEALSATRHTSEAGPVGGGGGSRGSGGNDPVGSPAQKTAHLLRRVWQLYQVLFDKLGEVHQAETSRHARDRRELEEKLRHAEKHGGGRGGAGGMAFGGLRASVANIVFSQLNKIRQKRAAEEQAKEEARVAALLAPMGDATAEAAEKKKQAAKKKAAAEAAAAAAAAALDADQDDEAAMDEAAQARAQAMALAYSGCASRLDHIANEMLHSLAEGNDKLNKDEAASGHNSSASSGGKKKSEWVILPGATATVEYFSAMARTNVDLSTILKRGQRVRIGPRAFQLHEEAGEITADSLPLDTFWPSPTSEGLSIYVQRSDAARSPYDDGSDMEDDDIDWVLLPATVSVTKGDTLAFTSSAVNRLVKRGSRVKVAGSLFTVGAYGHFNEECFPLSSAWVSKSADHLPLFADAEGVIGWDPKRDMQDAAAAKLLLAGENLDTDGSAASEGAIWVTLTGIAVSVNKGSERCRTSCDPQLVLRRGQVVSIGPLKWGEVYHVNDKGPFNQGCFTLDRPWEVESGKSLILSVRKHEIKLQARRLRNALRCLGMRGRNLDPDAEYVDGPGTQTSEAVVTTTTTTTTDGEDEKDGPLHVNTQSECTAPPGIDFLTTLQLDARRKTSSAWGNASGTPGGVREWRATRHIMHVQSACLRRGTPPLALHACLQIFDAIMRDKAEHDEVEDMLGRPRISIPEFVSDWFVHRFGLKNVADDNLGRFILSLSFHAQRNNAYARVGCRLVGWLTYDGGDEAAADDGGRSSRAAGTRSTGSPATHIPQRLAQCLLDDFRGLLAHPVGFVKELAGLGKGKKEEVFGTGENTAEGKAMTTAVADSKLHRPRCSVLAAWDVLRRRLIASPAARQHFAMLVKRKKRKRRKKGHASTGSEVGPARAATDRAETGDTAVAVPPAEAPHRYRGPPVFSGMKTLELCASIWEHKVKADAVDGASVGGSESWKSLSQFVEDFYAFQYGVSERTDMKVARFRQSVIDNCAHSPRVAWFALLSGWHPNCDTAIYGTPNQNGAETSDDDPEVVVVTPFRPHAIDAFLELLADLYPLRGGTCRLAPTKTHGADVNLSSADDTCRVDIRVVLDAISPDGHIFDSSAQSTPQWQDLKDRLVGAAVPSGSEGDAYLPFDDVVHRVMRAWYWLYVPQPHLSNDRSKQSHAGSKQSDADSAPAAAATQDNNHDDDETGNTAGEKAHRTTYKKRGRWLDLTQPMSFVASAFRRIEELAHVDPLLVKDTGRSSSACAAYIDLLQPTKADKRLLLGRAVRKSKSGKTSSKRKKDNREQTDCRRVAALAVDLYAVLEIISDTCAEAQRQDYEETVRATRLLFEAAHVDKDGLITIDEFKTLVQSAGGGSKANRKLKVNPHELVELYRECLELSPAGGQMTAEAFCEAVLHHEENARQQANSAAAASDASGAAGATDGSSLTRYLHKQLKRAVRSRAKQRRAEQRLQRQKEREEAARALALAEAAAAAASAAAGADNGDDLDPDANREGQEGDTVRADFFQCTKCGRVFVRVKGLEAHVAANECGVGLEETGDGGGEDKNSSEDDEDGDGNEAEEGLSLFDLAINERRNSMGLAAAAKDDEAPSVSGWSTLSQLLAAGRLREWNARRIFDALDTDGSGLLSIHGFRGKCRRLFCFEEEDGHRRGFYPSKQETSAFFRLLDNDRSGDIEWAEFEQGANICEMRYVVDVVVLFVLLSGSTTSSLLQYLSHTYFALCLLFQKTKPA